MSYTPAADVLTIFSQPGCVQCTAAERHAKNKNIPYEKIDVTETPEAYTLVSEWGYKRVPVLFWEGEHVGGFDPNFLEAVHKSLTPVAA